MRRLTVAAVLTGFGVLAGRALAPRLHARMLAACERMFEQVPENFPPKRMLRGIEEIRANTARTLELLEDGREAAQGQLLGDGSTTTETEAGVVAA